MKSKFQFFVLLATIFLMASYYSCSQTSIPKGQVQLGIDVLKADNFKILEGKRIALITNHTGCDRNCISDIDLLYKASNVNLVKLFSPEHGIRGTGDGIISNEQDETTNLPIFSLYGKTKMPTPESLEDIDLLVFDIQDIGTRFYTYISTMAYVMRAAQMSDKEVVVLDRPNPIGGLKVEGTIPPDSLSNMFTSIFPIPTRHGMTIGELAQMFNREFGINCRLTVVPMQGWKRSMYYDETGIVWIYPSPNMKTLTGAILYPGLGVLETTGISMGRGTDIPFEIYGAPWINGRKLAIRMDSYGLKGVRFVAWGFTPGRKHFKYYSELCEGVKAIVYDKEAFDGYLTGLYLAKTIWELHPEEYTFTSGFKYLMGCPETEKWIKSGVSPEKIKARKTAALEQFKQLRAKYLMYE